MKEGTGTEQIEQGLNQEDLDKITKILNKQVLNCIKAGMNDLDEIKDAIFERWESEFPEVLTAYLYYYFKD